MKCGVGFMAETIRLVMGNAASVLFGADVGVAGASGPLLKAKQVRHCWACILGFACLCFDAYEL